MPYRQSLPTDTTHKAAIAWEAVEPTVRALRDTLAKSAGRRPETPAPADLLALARLALRRMAPITASLGVPPLLPLHGTPTLLGLSARLAIAAQHLSVFRETYWLGQVEDIFVGWAVGQPVQPGVRPQRSRRKTPPGAAPGLYRDRVLPDAFAVTPPPPDSDIDDEDESGESGMPDIERDYSYWPKD